MLTLEQGEDASGQPARIFSSTDATDPLPERITLAKQQHLPHADFLELVLADEVARRDTHSAALCAVCRTRSRDASGHLVTGGPRTGDPESDSLNLIA